MTKFLSSVTVALVLFALPVSVAAAASKTSAAKSTSADEAGEDLTARLVVGGKDEAAPAETAAGVSAAAPVEIAPAPAPEAALKPAEAAKLPENQIPVLTGTKDTKKAAGGGMTRVFISLGVLGAALIAAFFGLKRISKRGAEKNKNTRIKVLTQHALGPKKSLVIVQVAGESILIGVTDHNISMLKSLSLIDDEIPETVPRDFNRTLDDFDETEEVASPRARPESHDQDDFAVQGLSEIRDKVSTRLRSMKHL